MAINKDVSVETMRGMAILLVIAGHVIGSDGNSGMRVADDSCFRYLYCLFENIRMPLFTVISGWVYALHPLTLLPSYPRFMGKKVRRLLFPMIFVGATYYLLQYLVPGTNAKMAIDSIWRIAIFPYTYYWYLPALFLLFGIFVLMDCRGWMRTVKRWSIVVLFALVLCYAELTGLIPRSIPNFFAFKGMLYLSPFFVLGIGLSRFREQLFTPRSMTICFTLTLVGVVLQQFYYFMPESMTWYETAHFKVLIGMVSTGFLMQLKVENRLLVRLAQYAYTLYLLHGFGTSGGRIIFSRLGVNNDFLVFLASFLCAIILPIIVDRVFRHIPLLNLLFLGKKSKSNIPISSPN